MTDPINPDYYQDTPPNSGIRGECIDYAQKLDFCSGSAFKYVWRAGRKDDARQDLEKAVWYLRRAIRASTFHRQAYLSVDGAVPQTPRRRILHLIASSNTHHALDAICLIEHALTNDAALATLDGRKEQP